MYGNYGESGVECSATWKRAVCEISNSHLKRPHQNELLQDAPQNRCKQGACGATIKNSDQIVQMNDLHSKRKGLKA